MAGDECRLVAHWPQALGDRMDQLLLVPVREIPAADRAAEQHVADQRDARFRLVEDDVPGGVARAVPDVEGDIANGCLVAIGEPARRLERPARNASRMKAC